MKSAAVLGIFALVFAAGSTPAGKDATGNPLLDDSTRENLANAAGRYADGDSRRSQAYASLAALPNLLTVYIDGSKLDWERSDEVSEWAREGLQAWNDTLLVNISEVSDRENASVVIEFKDSVRRGSHAGYLTSHKLARYGAYGVVVEVSGRIEVANRMPSGRLMNEAQVRKVVMHELGHLFGLQDVRDSNAMMGPVSRNPGFAPVDADAINALMEMDSQARAYMTPAAQAPTMEARQYVPKVFEFAEPR